MKSLYLVLALILSLSATTRVEATNDEILQEFLGSLCEVNTVGAYASCCSNNANGTSATTSNLPGCFGNVDSQLTSLIIVDKGLSVIPSGVFSNFTNLESLYLYFNSLTTIESGAFEGLGNLYTLDLHSNPITELPSGAFKDSPFLRYLTLTSLSLTKIVTGTFDSLSSLYSLNLVSNSIAELPSGAFKDLSNLDYLSLKSNSLTKLATGTFEGLNNLNTLNLQSNSLVYLEENIFGSNSVLPTSLYLQSNNLITLPDRFSSTTTASPSNINAYYNCLDCNRYTGMSYVSCYNQYDTYCPRTTNLCNTRNKFQKDNCFKCNSSETDAFCDICMPGYKHTVSGCGCVKCEEGDSCVFGEVRVPSTVCAGCSSSLPSKCSSCAMDYKYVNGDCAACGNNECCPGGSGSIIPNCTSCNENRTGCYSCEVGTKYVPIGDEPYGECTKCGNNECCVGKTYTEGCARCMDDMSGCKTCHVGYYPVNGECLMRRERECWPEDWNGSIKIEHCISCKDEEKGCALCDKEYRNQGGVCVEKGKYVDGGSMKMSWMMMMVMAFVVACVSVIGWI